MTHQAISIAKNIAPLVDFWSIRIVEKDAHSLSMRQSVLEPPSMQRDLGAQIAVMHEGGIGYCSSSDLSENGLKIAFQAAQKWAKLSKKIGLFNFSQAKKIPSSGTYRSPLQKPWNSFSPSDKITWLSDMNRHLKANNAIVDWVASLDYVHEKNFFASNNSGLIEQEFHYFTPSLSATAHKNEQTQTRSLGGIRSLSRQGGFEALDQFDFKIKAQEIANEALELACAPNCPSQKMDILIAPDQMMLQIHESIGHPLELDRILGDERNYAGTSFVSLDMFGSYQYGSSLLNITFDPTIATQFATYGFDDEGSKAEKVFVIKDGILKVPLGCATSQSRAKLPGVANARASNWNRTPIDRMANLNLVAGDSSFEDMIAQIENGIYVKTNISWSIDDSRNKFQFGCEWGQLIKNGELKQVVRNPNYRGISANFWRSLKMVGNHDTFEVLGTPFCGKGEPNQCIHVGHASPACVFSNVDVFGGEE